MDFFDRQTRARRESRRLAWLFGFAVLAVLAVNNLLLGTVVACFRETMLANASGQRFLIFILTALNLAALAVRHPVEFVAEVLRLQPMGWISLGTLLSIAGGSWYKIRELAAGGPVVARLLGGRRVAAGTEDADERRLRNVVEEMAIASGLPVPEIFVLDCERGINTFAAGHTHQDLAVAVTRGALQLLTRDELQGVIAHEFSHILNGDTRLNMRLIGLAHGFFWPTLLGRVLIYGQSEAPPPGASVLVERDHVKLLPTAPLGILLVINGSFSLPFVRLIKSAIGRQREWLADAAAVQFTRNPAGIAGALKKIGGLFKQGRLDTPHAEVASHLYLVDYHDEPWFSFLATHPPLRERVKILEPAFDGNFPKVKMLVPNQAERDRAYHDFLAESLELERRWADARAPMVLEPVLAEPTEAINAECLRRAAIMRLCLGDEIKTALQSPEGAANLVYALLLSDDETIRTQQREILRVKLEPSAFGQFMTLGEPVAALADGLKLPLAELAVPALREHDPAAGQNFSDVLQQIIECNGSLGLFEYALTRMVRGQLRCPAAGAPPPPRFGRVRDMLPECAILLSALAHVGNDGDEAAARAAFAKGAEFLDAPGQTIEFVPRSGWDLADVDGTLDELAGYEDSLRRNLVLACGKTVSADGRVTVREAELLRAIASALGCPLPPFVQAIRNEALSAGGLAGAGPA